MTFRIIEGYLLLTDFIKCHSSPILHRGTLVSRVARCGEFLSTSRPCVVSYGNFLTSSICSSTYAFLEGCIILAVWAGRPTIEAMPGFDHACSRQVVPDLSLKKRRLQSATVFGEGRLPAVVVRLQGGRGEECALIKSAAGRNKPG